MNNQNFRLVTMIFEENFDLTKKTFRSIMLAREGYCVLELGYNLPQYGQKNLFTRTDPISADYFAEAIRRFLKHPKVYGDQVALLGQSKGVDIAIGVASLFPELISVVITNSGHLMSPIVLPLAKGSNVIPGEA